MKYKFYYRKYGNIESLLQQLNENIAFLTSYIIDNDNNKIDDVSLDSTIGLLKKIKGKLEDKSKFRLINPICINDCTCVETLEDAIKYSARFTTCGAIENAWRISLSTCTELNKTIDEMAKAINALGNNPENKQIVDDTTKLCQLVRICKHDDFYPLNQLDEQKMKDILKTTIKETYKPSRHFGVISGALLALGIIAFILFGCCSCKNNNKNNRNADRVSITILKEGDKTTFSYSLCDSMAISVEKGDSIIVEKGKNVCAAYPIQVIMRNDSCIVKDTVICLNIKYGMKVDTIVNSVTIFLPYKNNCSKALSREKKDESIQLFLIFKWTLLIIALTLMLIFVVRPIAVKLIESENKQNEKIINEKLRVQTEWQQILQDRYRLENRRVEIELNAIDKESKSEIDERVRANEHKRQMETKEKEIELEKYRINNSSQIAINQLTDKRLRDLNEQIAKVLSSFNQ